MTVLEPLSYNQHRYLAQLLADPLCSESAEHVQVLHVDGVDPDRVVRALGALFSMHDGLRAVIRPSGSEYRVDYAEPGSGPALLLGDAREPSAAPGMRRRVQDSIGSPLFRARVDAEDGGTRVTVAAHHLIYDGWSWLILMRQLERMLGSVASGTTIPRETAPSYAAFARNQVADWERRSSEERRFWERKTATLDTPDLGRGRELLVAEPDYVVESPCFDFPEEIEESLTRTCRQLRMSKFAVLRATTAAAFSEMVDWQDLVLASDHAFRTPGINDQLFGFVVTAQCSYLRGSTARWSRLPEIAEAVERGFTEARSVESGCLEQSFAEIGAPAPLKISQALEGGSSAFRSEFISLPHRHWRPISVMWSATAKPRNATIYYRSDMMTLDFVEALASAITRRLRDV